MYKVIGGLRLAQVSKKGKIINTKGAFGQSSYQKLMNQIRRVEAAKQAIQKVDKSAETQQPDRSS